MPTLPAERLASAYLYYDARADDARLCLTVARTAAAHGAVVANGATRRRAPQGRRRRRSTAAAVVADGERVRRARPRRRERRRGVGRRGARPRRRRRTRTRIRPAKGIHLTVPWEKVRNDIAVVIPVPKDKRSLFVVPWGERTRTSAPPTPTTTARSTTRSAPRTTSPTCCGRSTIGDDRRHRGRRHGHVGRPAAAREAGGAGQDGRPVPPAPGRAGDQRRVTVTGGKLTTYRRMAADTVDVADGPPRTAAAGRRTKRLHLLGAEGYAEPARPDARQAPPRRPLRHAGARGRGAASPDDPSLAEPLVPGLPYVRAEAVYAARHEMARTLDDVLSRRTRARLLRPGRHRGSRRRGRRLVAPELGWDDDEVERQVTAYRRRSSTRSRPATIPAIRRWTRPSEPERDATPTAAHRARRAVPSDVRARLAEPAPLDAAVREALVAACPAHEATDACTPSAPRPAGTGGRWPCTGPSPGQVPARWPSCVVPPGRRRRGGRRAAASANEPGVPVTAAGGRSGVCGAQRAGARRRRCSTSPRWPASSPWTTTSLVGRRAARHVRARPRGRPARRTG